MSTAQIDGVDAVALGRWLAEHVDGVDTTTVAVELISGGASNLTIGVDAGGRMLVVRRPPIGAFLPSANDVAREYRYLTALQTTEVPVPKVHAYCADSDVVGAPFYVMERVHGVVPHDVTAVHGLTGLTAAQGRMLSEAFIDVLSAIHNVDIDDVGLGDAAKRTGYVDRQVHRWTDQWHRAADAESPVIDELARALVASTPTSPPATLVHGDYRLGNVMLDAEDRTQIVAVLDWEMATLGDPLADLGWTLLLWGTHDRPAIHPSQAIADLPGFIDEASLVARYGVDTDLTFYVALAAFKLAVITEGNRARARRLGLDEVTTPPDGLSLAAWGLELLASRR